MLKITPTEMKINSCKIPFELLKEIIYK